MPGPKYVKEFEFPKSAGFHEVRFMARGGRAKVGKVMGEYKAGELRSGSKTGPVVTNPKQARAIAMSEAGLSKPNYKARAERPGGMKHGGVAEARKKQGALGAAAARMPAARAARRGYPVDDGKPKFGR